MSAPSEQVITADKLHDLRRRILSGEEYTKEQLRASVFALFGERIAQAQAVATSSTKRPKKSVNLDDLVSPASPKIDLSDLT